MKAISIRQPWAWLIVNGFKDIENRSWNTKFRGPILIHASSRRPTKAEVVEAREILKKSHGIQVALSMPQFDQFQLGGFVGMATITGCVSGSTSPWFFGPTGFTLAEAKPLRFHAYRGQLSIFESGLRKHGVFNFLVENNYRDITEGTL